MQVNVSIRMDSDMKTQAEHLFNQFGLSLTAAVNAFIRHSLREQTVLFPVGEESPPDRAAILAEMREIVKSIQEDSKKNGTDKMTMEEIDAVIAESRRERRMAGR